jgi:hypothetical protein
MILSGRAEFRTGWIAGVLLLLVATAVLPLAAVAQALAEPIKTELKLKNTRFTADAPIIVVVWVENQSEQDIERNQFSPISSSVGLPSFLIVRVPDGKEFSIPPGLYGDDWDQWYQPVSGKRAFSVGGFNLPSRKRIHLLHGDLRLTVVRAREHCQRALDAKFLLERPDNASTKKSYQEIVRSADDFLSGGTFDICARAYSKSQTIRITVDKKDTQGASDDRPFRAMRTKDLIEIVPLGISFRIPQRSPTKAVLRTLMRGLATADSAARANCRDAFDKLGRLALPLPETVCKSVDRATYEKLRRMKPICTEVMWRGKVYFEVEEWEDIYQTDGTTGVAWWTDWYCAPIEKR